MLIFSRNEAMQNLGPNTITREQFETISMSLQSDCTMDTCPVCHSDYELGQDVQRLVHCGHIFHDACIFEAMSKYVRITLTLIFL